MQMQEQPIGFLDSGVGGIGTLDRAMRLLPQEHFRYFGDLGNAPYGTRSQEEILTLSMAGADRLVSAGAKALVVACNTATSGAIDDLRARLAIPVIGTEPALKPAVAQRGAGKVVVMATPATLRLPKFAGLVERFGAAHQVVALPCPGLSLLVERAGPGSDEIRSYLQEIFHHVNLQEVDSIVIGCTHYSFVVDDIRAVAGPVRLFDGDWGTAYELKHRLEQAGLLLQPPQPLAGQVELTCSGNQEKGQALMRRFLAMARARRDHECQMY